MRHLKVVFFFVSLGVFSACNLDNNESTNPIEMLDDRLEQALIDASNGKGLDFFTMPESDDYANIPQDPKNPLTKEKVELGKLLYHETGLATSPVKSESKGHYSCASCHFAEAGFQANRHQGIGEGGVGFGHNGNNRQVITRYLETELDVQPIRTPTAMNGAYQELMLWNGQFGGVGDNLSYQEQWKEDTPIATNHLGYEGLETQAIAGLKVHRLGIDSSVLALGYKALFDQVFPEVDPAERYTNEYVGLAIAAYERTLLSNNAPFQKWLRGDRAVLSMEEKQGAILFFDKANCVSCHTGPALNAMEFHAIGMSGLDKSPEPSFMTGPDHSANLGRGGFTKREADNYKFKVPQLYNLIDSPFYGHGSTFNKIRDVVDYKNEAIPESDAVPSAQLAPAFKPLNLSDDEVDAITTFLTKSLNDFNLRRYVPEDLLSGQCFPNNDPNSQNDLGCN